MPIMGDIKNLYSDKNQSRALFPTTKIKAISDDDGKGLNAVLDDMTAYTRKVGNPYNLLDNSDFRNPVNQRGAKSYSGAVYMIDRWKGANADLTINDGSIVVSRGAQQYGLFAQFVPNLVIGKTYTFAAKKPSGEVAVCVFVPETDMGIVGAGFEEPEHFIQARYSTASQMFYVAFSTASDVGLEVEWAALYEGEYTAETLPEYQPKGYAAELAECRRYFRNLGTVQLMGFTIAGSKVVRIMGKEYSGMRIEEPTVGGTVTGVTSTTGEAAETIPTHTLTIPATEIRVNFVSAVSGIPTLRNCMVDFTGLTLSADL